MKRGAAPQKSRRMLRARVRALAWLFGSGLLLLALGPLYAFLALNYSGELALAQKVSAADVARGFDFGPVYMSEGVPGRYYLSAVLPEVDGDFWHTSFEVLDETRQPVYRQDELRIIGDFEFTPGESERHVKNFTLDKQSGYYFFRYTAVNGVYNANQTAVPVVEFAVRQNVITGPALWGPAAGAVLAGLILFALALALVRAINTQPRCLESPVQRSPESEVNHPFADRQWRRSRPR